MQYILIFITQALCLLVVLISTLSQEYITDGMGLHPVLGGMIIALAILFPYSLAVKDKS